MEKEILEEVSQENQSEKGATMLEYALLAALIAVVCIASITFLGNQANNSFNQVGAAMDTANTIGAGT